MEWNIREVGFIRDDTANHRGKDGARAVSPPWGKIKDPITMLKKKSITK